MWSTARRHPVLFCLIGFIVVVVAVSHQFVASPRLVKAAVTDAVPGYACPDIQVENPSGSWSKQNHIMRAALWLPRQCTIDLKRRIRTSPLFRADRCGLVERCWIRESEHKTYTFTFHPAYVSFHFEQHSG
jgi:hypothetical protein